MMPEKAWVGHRRKPVSCCKLFSKRRVGDTSAVTAATGGILASSQSHPGGPSAGAGNGDPEALLPAKEGLLEKNGLASRTRQRLDGCLKGCRRLLDRQFWQTCSIDPSSHLYYRWLMVVSLAVLYNLIMIIARQVFWLLQARYAPLWFVLDYICDVIYIIDMMVQFRTDDVAEQLTVAEEKHTVEPTAESNIHGSILGNGILCCIAAAVIFGLAYLEHGILVEDISTLHARYLKSTKFKVAVISLLPTDILYVLIGTKNPALRFNRLLRANRLTECVTRFEVRTNYPNGFRIVNLFFYILLAIHFNACFYFQISSWAGLGSDEFLYKGTEKNIGGPNLAQDYWACFYWSFMMLTTIGEMGDPVENYQFIIMTSLYLCGVLVIASILGNVGTSVARINEARADFQQTFDNVKHYMAYRHVGAKLETQVVRWFDYLWTDDKSNVDESILSELPESCQAEIAMNVHMETLKRVAIFQDCDQDLIAQLVLKLKLVVFGPGDFVCRKGDIGKEMYILKRGKLVVVGDDGETVLAALHEGTVFGEISVLDIVGNKHGNRRTANIRCTGYTDLFVLSKEALWEALKDYPETGRRMREKGREMLRKDDLLDEEVVRREETIRPRGTLEERAAAVEKQLDSARTSLARLLADFSATRYRLTNRAAALEDQLANLERTDGSRLE